MVKNIIKITLRNLLRYPGYSLINILGLSTGLMVSILILLYVQDELSYDKHFEGHEHIYRLQSYYLQGEEESTWTAGQGFMIPTLTAEYSEIEKGLRLCRPSAPVLFSFESEQFLEKNFLHVDSTFFDVFSLEFEAGSPENAMSLPRNLTMTASTAQRYFGNTDPIGQLVQGNGVTYTVAAVVQDLPTNSHFKFDMLVPMADLRSRWPSLDGHGPARFYSYIKLNPATNTEVFFNKVNADVYRHYGYNTSADSSNVPEDLTIKTLFQPLSSIHLSGNQEKEMESNNDVQYIKIFASVAVLVILLACVNYMNLASARSARRGKEVALRKVMGAEKRLVFIQFMTESYCTVFLSLVLALIGTWLVLPEFNEATGKMLAVNLIDNTVLLGWTILIVLITGFFAGIYPALVLSSMGIIKVLKNTGGLQGSQFTIYLRRGLVLFQFTISVLLITGTLVINQQLHFIDARDAGFEKEGVLVMNLPMLRGPSQEVESLRNALSADASFVAASASSVVPGQRVHVMTVRIPEIASAPPQEGGETDNGYRGIRIISCDPAFLKTYKISVAEGRDFNHSVNDQQHAFLLNEAAVEFYNIKDPIGKPFEYVYGLDTPKVGAIIGVVKNFNYASLKSEVEPLMLHLYQPHKRFVSVRFKGDAKTAVEKAKTIWETMLPAQPFDFFFLDSFYDNMYKEDTSLGSIITTFTMLAILVACLGLFGLASFMAELKTKELGIRKVLGATPTALFMVLFKEFLVLVLVANVLAVLPSWFLLNQWLDSFVYHIQIDQNPFLIALVLAVAVALLSVGYKIVSAILRNPIHSIQQE